MLTPSALHGRARLCIRKFGGGRGALSPFRETKRELCEVLPVERGRPRELRVCSPCADAANECGYDVRVVMEGSKSDRC